MLSRRLTRGFRPGLERVEERALTAGGLGLRAAALAFREHLAEVRAERAAEAADLSAAARPVRPRPGPVRSLPIGPGLGQGLIRISLPSNTLDYGVATLWNNTTSPVTFGVSASTYANGQYVFFTLAPGSYQAYYAPYTANGQPPVMRVAINPDFPPVTLPQLNTIFETSSWVPTGTEGRPYAINVGVNGLYLSYI